MECLYAYTAPGGSFPPYLNMSFDGNTVIVTVRSAPEEPGFGGASASIRIPADEFFAHVGFLPAQKGN